MLSFQRLDCYQTSIHFLALAIQVIRELPRGHADDADQLRRAAKSVVRNIAEGAGRITVADKAHRYTLARGEAMECVCSLDVMKVEGTITADQHLRGTQLLERVVAMLTKLIAHPRRL